MDVEEIRAARLAHPFRPFSMVMSDGKRLLVDEPCYLAISPDSTLLLFSAKDGSFPRFSPSHVTRLDFDIAARASGQIAGQDKGAA